MATRAIEAGRAFLKLLIEDKEFHRGLNSASRRLNVFGKSLKQTGSLGAIGGGFKNLFVGAGASAALAYPVKLAANVEIASAQLSIFVGSATKAREILLDLQSFSATSFIPLEQLSNATALLSRYGIGAEQAVASTKALATIAAGDVFEFDKLALAFAQVASAGRLQGQEMMQLKNTAFNPLREIAERTGETMDDVRARMEAAAVPFEEVAAALQAATSSGGRFHGILAAIAGTLTGQVLQAFAEFKKAMISVGEAMLPPLKRVLQTINFVLPAFTKFAKENNALVGALTAVSAVIVPAGLALVAFGYAAHGAATAITALRIALTALSRHPYLVVFTVLATAVAAIAFKLIDLAAAEDKANSAMSEFEKMSRKAEASLKAYETGLGQEQVAMEAGTGAINARIEVLKRLQEQQEKTKSDRDVKAEELRLIRLTGLEEQLARSRASQPMIHAMSPAERRGPEFDKWLKDVADLEKRIASIKGLSTDELLGGKQGARPTLEFGPGTGPIIQVMKEEFARRGGRGGFESPPQTFDNLPTFGPRGTFSGRLAPQIFGAGGDKLTQIAGKQLKKSEEMLKRLQNIDSKIKVGPGFRVGLA